MDGYGYLDTDVVGDAHRVPYEDLDDDRQRHLDVNRDVHLDGYMDAESYGYGDLYAHVDPDRDVDVDIHSDLYAHLDVQSDPDGHFHLDPVLHSDGDLDGDLDGNGHFYVNDHRDGDRHRHFYPHDDGCPFQLSGCVDVGSLSQPGDQRVLAHPVRPAVGLSQDVALGHQHEREPNGGLGDRVGLRARHPGLGPT